MRRVRAAATIDRTGRVGRIGWIGTVCAAGALAGQLMVLPAGSAAATTVPAAAQAGTSAGVQTAVSLSPERFRPKARFAREPVRAGDRDSGVHRIEHVRELQYRLRWADVYKGPVTGYFGDLTKAAVKRFQKKAHLRVSGSVTPKVWAELLRRTVRNEDAKRCKHRVGWHACYDRHRHQVTLWKRNTLWNTWLVRGGARQYPTRVGSFYVYRRDRDHVSSIYNTPMPYSQFFSGGQAFHGSAFMTDPFVDHSHGCVNMYIEDARQLWKLTHSVRLNVHVYGRWS